MYQISNPVGDANAKPEYKARNQFADVLIVQRLLSIASNSLNKREYHPGKIDGYIGPGTNKAIVAFQKSFWTTPDGLVEPSKNSTGTFSRLVAITNQIPAVQGTEKLSTLNADFRIKAGMAVDKMRALGWHLRIVWGRRTKSENDALVAKGIASKTSKHLDGLAVDMIDTRVGYSNDRKHQYYLDLKSICDEIGLTWGGSFSTRWDPTHFEEKGIPVGAASQLQGNSASC